MTLLYYKTWNYDGKESAHLSYNGDQAICGMDLVVDNEIHERPPVRLSGDGIRVTCPDCLGIVKTVQMHLASYRP